MIAEFAEKKSVFYFLGLLVALVGLSLNEIQLSVTLPSPSYVSFSGRIAWSYAGFPLFLVGEIIFFTSLIFLIEEKKIWNLWVAQVSKTALFIAAALILVQRVNGYTALDGPSFGLSLYVESVYTDITQYIILISVFTTLFIVVATDFILRRGEIQRPSERFYLASGFYNFTLGTIMAASVLLTASNYSFYPIPGDRFAKSAFF